MAIERPHLGRFAQQQVVSVHVVTPRAEIEPAMRAALDEITGALQAQSVAPTGPWFAHHHRRPTETFDFHVCFPVDTTIALSGRLEQSVVPETEVIRTAYHGPYEGLPKAWPEFIAWIEGHGYETHEEFFEVYSVGPRENPDPEAWQTDFMCPLAKGQLAKDRLV